MAESSPFPQPEPRASLGGSGNPPDITAVGTETPDPEDKLHPIFIGIKQRVERHGLPPFSESLMKVLVEAQEEASILEDGLLTVEHVFLGLLHNEDVSMILRKENPLFDIGKIRYALGVGRGESIRKGLDISIDAWVTETLWNVAEKSKEDSEEETGISGLWNASRYRMIQIGHQIFMAHFDPDRPD